jgi:hypothetical protein
MLRPQEYIVQQITHKNHLPFRVDDLVRTFVFSGFIVAAIASISSDGFVSVGSLLLLAVIFFFLLPLFNRWKNVRKSAYFLTNQRLIICDTKRCDTLYSFELSEFPQMTLSENPYNSGYIILGEVQETFVSSGGKTGVNTADHGIVLENIPEVRKIYELIRIAVDEARCKHDDEENQI